MDDHLHTHQWREVGRLGNAIISACTKCPRTCVETPDWLRYAALKHEQERLRQERDRLFKELRYVRNRHLALLRELKQLAAQPDPL